jgi:hypothetical protein
MTNSSSRRGSRLATIVAVVACGGALGIAPAAHAQDDTVDNATKAVQTVVGSLTGGVQSPHSYDCDENHPKVQEIINGVKDSLKTRYPNMTTMLARGYAPYVDAPLFGLSGGQGHWLNPGFLEDGHIMDPRYPEGILVDRWNRPIGVMFITDHPNQPGPDMYVADDGTPCNAWHYHTETFADTYWYAYKYGWSDAIKNGDIWPEDRSPDLMHVWAYGDYKHQWQHRTPPREQLPGDPTPQEIAQGIGGPRAPGTPPSSPPDR